MLHETTQRRVCRIAFVVGCVLPTLCVVVATARVWLPGYATHWEQPLGQLLDCRATLERFEMPRPGIVRCERVVLADPETYTPWAVLHDVSHETLQGRSFITIAHAELACGAAAEIGERVERLLRENDSRELALTIGSLVVNGDSQSLTLPNVRVQVASTSTGSQLQLWSEDSTSGLRLLVERNRQLEPPATQVTLHTGAGGIPCELLAGWDRFEQLGSQARFQGRMELTATRESAQGRISGQFSQLDLSPSQLAIDEVCWSTGRNDSLIGQLHTGPVAALLAQFSHEEPQRSAGEIGWQLAPVPQRANVAEHGERILQ
jgi:hypothetical protein